MNINHVLEDEYQESLAEYIRELELMTDLDAKMTVGITLDYLDANIRQLVNLKAGLREYLSQRKDDADILRAISKRYM